MGSECRAPIRQSSLFEWLARAPIRSHPLPSAPIRSHAVSADDIESQRWTLPVDLQGLADLTNKQTEAHLLAVMAHLLRTTFAGRAIKIGSCYTERFEERMGGTVLYTRTVRMSYNL